MMVEIAKIDLENVSFVPIYKQIEDYLREKILSNEIPPSSKLPTVETLAQKMGVNTRTLMRAMDRLCQQGLLIRQAGKGTFVTDKKNHTLAYKKTIGLISSWTDGSNLMGDSRTLSIFRAAKNVMGEPYDLQLLYHRWGTRYLDMYNSGNLDGILIIAPLLQDKKDLINLKKAGCKFVILSGIFNETDLDFIGVNFINAMNSAVNYLVKLGHRRIGYISGDLAATSHIERLKGYKTALNNNGLEFKEELFTTSIDEDEQSNIKLGYRGIDELTSLRQKPTAIICGDHEIVTGAISAIRNKGLEIPKDISLMLFSEPEILPYIEPRMTIIRSQMGNIGKVAAEELIKKLTGSKRKPSQILLETEILEGKSCAPPKK